MLQLIKKGQITRKKHRKQTKFHLNITNITIFDQKNVSTSCKNKISENRIWRCYISTQEIYFKKDVLGVYVMLNRDIIVKVGIYTKFSN